MPGNFGYLATSPFFNLSPGVPGKQNLRQYGTALQTLAANNVPMVKTTTGLGIGGGAFVRIGQTNGSNGEIEIVTGSNPLANGNVDLVFPNTPPTLFIGASEAFGTVVQTTTGNDIVIAWTGDKLLPNKRYRIAYQWATSK